MWRCLEVNFGIAAACLPTIYPGYRALKKRYNSRLSSSEKTDQLLLDPRTNSKNTRTTAAASAKGPSAVDVNIPMPEEAIIKSTRFGVRHGSDQSDSSEQELRGNHHVMGHSHLEV